MDTATATATATALIDELENQLTECVRRASTRAEHLRLTQLQETVLKLRSTATATATAAA